MVGFIVKINWWQTLMVLPSLSTRRAVTALMSYAGIVLLGVISLQNLAIDFLPYIG
jgi:multidrug efflux pump subunit AcrB